MTLDLDPYRGSDRRGRPGTDACRYRGPDRRDRAPLAVTSGRASGAGLVGLCAFAAIAMFAAPVMYGRAGSEVTAFALRDVSAGLLTLAGALSIVLWALTGRAARALDGAGFLVIGGGLLLISGPWSEMIDPGPVPMMTGAAGRLAVGLPGLAVLVLSARAQAVDTAVRPVPTLLKAGCAVLGILAIEALARMFGPIERSVVLVAMMIVLTGGYYVAGVLRLTKPPATASADDRTLGWALITWAFGDVLLSSALRASAWCADLGGVVQVAATAALVWAIVACLTEVLKLEGRTRLQLAGELTDVSEVLEDEQLNRRAMTHDARNAMAAIRTAMLTLERHGPRLEPDLQRQIRDGIGTEFVRLDALLDHPADASRASAVTTA